MSDALHVAAWMALVGGLALLVGGWVAWGRERRALRAWLREVVPGGRFREREELVRLKRRLAGAICYDEARMHDPRPPLRASAARVLATGEGFCGDNARVAVRLLRLGGVDAHRLYLEGERWGHVVVEHHWDGGWRLFDVHSDPRTALPDEAVARIATDDPAAFPNRAAENPWRGSYRIPEVGRLPLPGVRSARPPGALTALAETPALVAVAAGAMLILSGVALLVRS